MSPCLHLEENVVGDSLCVTWHQGAQLRLPESGYLRRGCYERTLRFHPPAALQAVARGAGEAREPPQSTCGGDGG